MNSDTHSIRQIDWRSLFPWLLLLRTTRFALAPSSLLVATLGLFAMSVGWGIAARLILGNELEESVRLADEVALLRTWPQPADAPFQSFRERADSAFLQPFSTLVMPVRRLFALETFTFREMLFYLVGTLWTFAVWAAAGGLIVRSALVRFAWDQPADPWQTFQFVAERYLSYFTAPMYPLLGVALLMTPLFIAGLLSRFDFGALLVSLFWFVGLLCSLAAVWLLIPLTVGFPLMWGAISAERDGDAFEALSHSMAYTYQRPLRFLGYVLLLIVLGGLSVLVVDITARAVVHISYWGLSWGSGAERAIELRQLAEQGPLAWNGPREPGRVLQTSGWLLGMWTGLVSLVAAGFRYSFFWTAAAGVYLLLRKDVDDKEIDEVYVPHEEPHLSHVKRRDAAPNASSAAAAPPTPTTAATVDAVSPTAVTHPPEGPQTGASPVGPA